MTSTWNRTAQILAFNVSRERLEALDSDHDPHINLFVTRSPQKALVWSQLEPLDLVIVQFGEPVDTAMVLLEGLIEVNPGPPILLLVEPAGELVAHRLARQEICHTLPASIAPELFREQVRQLLTPATGRRGARPEAPRRGPTAPQTASMPSAARPSAPPVPVEPAAPAQQAPAAATPAVESIPFLDQLVIELAHRLKNPLVSIKTFTHLLRERFDDPEFRHRFYSVVSHDVTVLNELIERLLEFSEFIIPAPKPLSIVDELAAAREAVEPGFRARNISFVIEASPSLPRVFADPLQFRYLLRQVLTESAAVARDGSPVRLMVLDAEAPTCTLAVEATLAHARQQREWLSFELLVAKNLLGRHGGALELDSTTSNGTDRRVVTMTLPCGPASRPAVAPKPHPLAAAQAGRAIGAWERRQIPLSIAFQERRQGARRRQEVNIAFSERRRGRAPTPSMPPPSSGN